MLRRANPDCKACGGSGFNSRGGLCSPCQNTGQPVLELPPREVIHATLMARSAEIKAEAAKPKPKPVDPALEGFV